MKGQELSTRQIMNRIYQDVCGFDIPKKEEKDIKNSKGSPVYGEIQHTALNQLLRYLRLTPKDILYDLGSGVGKVIVQTALVTQVKKAVGVELSESRYKESMDALNRARDFDRTLSKRCEFLHDDLMKADLSKATVIYTCSTAFSLAFMKKFVDRLSSLKQDFRLVTLQDLPSEKYFSLVDTLKLDMTWIRKTPVHVYRRRS